MAWAGRDLKDHLIANPLPWTGIPEMGKGWISGLAPIASYQNKVI